MNLKPKSLMDYFRTALGGAATACATREAAENNHRLTLDRVNGWAKDLNFVAGWIIWAYFVVIVVFGSAMYYSLDIAYDDVYSRMTPAEVAEFKERVKENRIGPRPVENAADQAAQKCEDTPKDKRK